MWYSLIGWIFLDWGMILSSGCGPSSLSLLIAFLVMFLLISFAVWLGIYGRTFVTDGFWFLIFCLFEIYFVMWFLSEIKFLFFYRLKKKSIHFFLQKIQLSPKKWSILLYERINFYWKISLPNKVWNYLKILQWKNSQW